MSHRRGEIYLARHYVITRKDQPKWIQYLQRFLLDMSQESLQLDIRVIQLGDAIIMTQPGEVFSETAVNLRKLCQQSGYKHALTISYANGSYGYLPPENAFAEGGYEVMWALGLGISRYLQPRIQAAIHNCLTDKVNAPSVTPPPDSAI